MLLSLFNSIKPLLWAILCLFLIIFLFSAILAQGVSDHFLEDTNIDLDDENTTHLLLKFDSLPRIILSLLECITGGEDWSDSYSPLEGVDGGYSLLFLLYICIMVFAVLNVITGVFVEGAISKARSDKELAMQEEMNRKEDIFKHLVQVFRKIDDDRSGSVDYTEWESFTAKTESQALFSLLGLDVSKTKDVFKLIDWDESGEIDMDEFINGCMHLQGSAKVVDLETLLRNHKKLFAKVAGEIRAVHTKMETSITEIKGHILRLCVKYSPEQTERSWI